MPIKPENKARRVAWVWPDDAKAGKPIAVPLNADALAVLAQQRALPDTWDKKGEKRKDPNHVFTYRGQPVFHTTTKAWNEALQRAGIEQGFTFHDLRHTWASWHVMAGTPLEVLRQLGGWAGMDMVLRYAHLAPGYVAGYAENVSLTISPTENYRPIAFLSLALYSSTTLFFLATTSATFSSSSTFSMPCRP